MTQHHYPVGVISLFLELVLSAAVSQRAAAAVLGLISGLLPRQPRLPCANLDPPRRQNPAGTAVQRVARQEVRTEEIFSPPK